MIASDADAMAQSAAEPAAIRREDVVVGSAAERYLKALSVLEDRRDRSWMIRGESPVLLGGDPGPWTIDRSADRLRFRGVQVGLHWNDRLPIAGLEGPMWHGRGLTVHASPAVVGRFGAVAVRLAPHLWWSENRPFELVPGGPFVFSDPAKGYSIDLPQRFGEVEVGRVDPGESSLAVEWGRARVALTSAAVRVGTGSEHAILLQGNHGGFPRIELGLPGGVATPVGRVTGGLGWGRLAQTRWAADRRAGARLGTFLVAGWTPPGDRFDVGVARFYHRDWAGVRARDLLVPFGSLFRDDQTLGLDAADNQLAVLFARLRAPAAGLEIFGEFGKNDRSADGRDLLVELEHNSAWLVGVQRVWSAASGGMPTGALRSLTLTGASGRIPAVTRFRGQASFFEHTPVSQGHTLRGQLLGTPLLERDGGAELRFDAYSSRGGHSVILSSRAMLNQRAEAVLPTARRHEWRLRIERRRRTGDSEAMVMLGGVADLGRGPDERDWFSLQAGARWTWLR